MRRVLAEADSFCIPCLLVFSPGGICVVLSYENECVKVETKEVAGYKLSCSTVMFRLHARDQRVMTVRSRNCMMNDSIAQAQPVSGWDGQRHP